MKESRVLHISELSRNYSKLFASMGKGYVLLDELGQAVDANEAYLLMCGVPPKVEGTDPLDSLCDGEGTREFFLSALDKPVTRVRSLNGNSYIEEGYPFTHRGSTYGVLTLTPKESVKDSLTQFFESDWSHTVYSIIPDTVIITDIDGNILYVSNQFYKLYQSSFSRNFVGNNIRSLFNDPFRSRLESILEEIVEAGSLRNVSVQITREDGQILEGEVSAAVLSDGSNEGIFILFHDITEQVRVKEILLEEALLNASVARLSQSIIGRDTDIKNFSQLFLDEVLLLTSCSGGFIAEGTQGAVDIHFHAISRDLIQSRKVRQINGRYSIPADSSLHSEFASMFRDYTEGFYTNAPDTDSPLLFFFEDKDPRLYNYLVIPLRTQNMFMGQMLLYSDRGKRIHEKEFDIVQRLGSIYVLAVLRFRRQNELENSRLQAEKANSAKGRLLTAMSAEIDPPLKNMDALLTGMLSTHIDKKQRQMLKELRWCREELRSVISNVLEMSRIESGNFELQYNEFNLFELLKGVWRESKETAVNRNITVEMSFPKKLGQQFKGDEGRLRQVLLNLVRYCIKFTKNDTIHMAFKERRRFNNTSEIEFQFKLSSGYLPTDTFTSLEEADAGNSEIEIVSTMQIVNKLRGSIESTVLNGRVQSFLIVIPLFCIG